MVNTERFDPCIQYKHELELDGFVVLNNCLLYPLPMLICWWVAFCKVFEECAFQRGLGQVQIAMNQERNRINVERARTPSFRGK